MNPRFRFFIVLIAIVALVAPRAVAAETKNAAPETESAANEKDGKKNVTVLVLTASPDAIHTAALKALASIGCEIKKDSPDTIEGKRPNKIGLAVGSGGEKVSISIKSAGAGKTEVKVTSKKTMLGIVGQKRWNEEVAANIRDSVK